MPFQHGRLTTLWLGSADLSAQFTSAEASVDMDTTDSTTFQSQWKSAVPGQATATIATEGLYDPTGASNTLPGLLQDSGDVLTIGPAGLITIGDLARLMLVETTAYTETAPVGGIVGFSWDAQATTALGFGYALHVLGADTNTTTGATRDDTAATATGWTAHLHVTAVTAGSWVVKLQDASASNFSDGADVTGGAFTAATAATNQRLQAASATTALRRYVRYVATRTGGTAGDSITFGLALARNQ